MLGNSFAIVGSELHLTVEGGAERFDTAGSGTIDAWRHPWSNPFVAGSEYEDGVLVEPAGGSIATHGVGAATFGPLGETIRAGQEQTYWCWAAAVQMLRRHVGLADSAQCEIASKRLGKPCCVAPATCNVRLQFDQVTNLLAENGLSSIRKRAQLDPNPFWEEIFANRPVLLADVFENGADGHLRVAFGWQQPRRGSLLVRVADPAGQGSPGGSLESIPFEVLQKSRWQETWYRIEVPHGAS